MKCMDRIFLMVMERLPSWDVANYLNVIGGVQ